MDRNSVLKWNMGVCDTPNSEVICIIGRPDKKYCSEWFVAIAGYEAQMMASGENLEAAVVAWAHIPDKDDSAWINFKTRCPEPKAMSDCDEAEPDYIVLLNNGFEFLGWFSPDGWYFQEDIPPDNEYFGAVHKDVFIKDLTETLVFEGCAFNPSDFDVALWMPCPKIKDLVLNEL